MSAFTYMSSEGIDEVTDRMPERYPLDLNNADGRMLVEALKIAYDNGEHTDPDGNCGPDKCAVCWAGDFTSGIAETLGVEFI